MDIGSFYFIKDQYFIDFPDDKLMANKEFINGKSHNRPCYYSVQDTVTGTYWAIPISSQTNKIQKIYEHKISRYGDCDTIQFGYILGEKKAFLIQNMYPVTDAYINNQYFDAATDSPVAIPAKVAAKIEQKAKKVLMLQRRGHRLIFPDVLKIEKELVNKNVLS